MYQIFADNTLIYDSQMPDYKIGKGTITKETDKSGSFVMGLHPDHPYYENIVPMRTVLEVLKSGRIVFRGRVLDDSVDYWNSKTVTCEGELGFLHDSIIRPYNFNGTPEQLFRKFIEEHNAQVDEFKRFKVGTCTVTDPSGQITRENDGYESAFSNINSRLIEGGAGGHFYITHGADGRDSIPTLHYLTDFPKVSTQNIEFGVNLRKYAKKTDATDVATAVIPLGAAVDDGDSETQDPRLTIAEVNNGIDYLYDAAAVDLYGWIFRVVTYDDVTDAVTLKAKAEEDLKELVNHTITVDLTAIDLNLLDRSIESFNVCEYVPISSEPHGFEATLLCSRQTLDLLKPENDTVTLGHKYSTFTQASIKAFKTSASVKALQASVNSLAGKVSTAGAELTEIITRLDTLESATLITVQVTATDAADELELLLSNWGALKVGGQQVTKGTTSATVHIGGAEVRYTLTADLETPRVVKANGVELGRVAATGDTVATVLSVTNSDTVAVEFIAGV